MRTLILCSILCLGIAVSASAQQQEQHLYQKQTGKTGYTFELTYKDGPQTSISVVAENVQEQAKVKPDGDTLRWQLDDRESVTKIEVLRQGNNLYVSGSLAGEKTLKTLQVDDAPWYQFLSWSLRAFVQSDAAQTTFWSLRPDTMKAYKMQAEKIGLTTLTREGRSQSALQVRIRPTGLFASLWHGDYWFASDSLVFLRYEAASGPPGSPKTRIEHLQQITRPN